MRVELTKVQVEALKDLIADQQNRWIAAEVADVDGAYGRSLSQVAKKLKEAAGD